MVRDEKKGRKARENGKNGGNPSLSKQKVNSSSDNQTDKGKDKPQRPETRDQRPDNPPTPHSEPDPPTSEEEEFLSDEIDWLASTGLGERQARSTVQLWLKDHDPTVIRDAIRQAQVSPKDNPSAWIGRVLANWKRDGQRSSVRARDFSGQDSGEGGGIHPDAETSKWRGRLMGWRNQALWMPSWGPKPGEASCQAPAELVHEGSARQIVLCELLYSSSRSPWLVSSQLLRTLTRSGSRRTLIRRIAAALTTADRSLTRP